MSKKIISFLATICLMSCSVPVSNTNGNTGFIKLGFKFPQKTGFSVKAIPTETEAFQIKIQGDGLNEAIEKKITKENSDKVLIQEIPVGNKNVEVKAMDSSGKVLAQATSNIEIKGGQVNQLTLELKQLLKNFKVKINNFSSSTPYVFAEFKAKNKTIQQEVKSNEIELTDIEPGDMSVKISAFSDDSTPVLNINKTIDTSKSDSEELNLESVILPRLSDLDASTASPIQFQNLIDQIKINFKENSAPKIEGMEVFVNGQSVNPSFNREAPVCLIPSDNIRITIKTSDNDNDKVNIFWGQNSLINSTYKMQLLDERGTSLSKSASDLGIGNHSIGFIATDRKSFVGPIGMYFSVAENKCN